MRFLGLVVFYIVEIAFQIEAAILNSRTFSSCGYLNKKIYCYGGDLSSSSLSYNIDTGLYSLDIDQYYGDDSSSFNSKWNIITSQNTFNLERRRTPQFAVLPQKNIFILVGGQDIEYSGPYDILSNQTIMYNATNNTWSNLPQYSEPYRKTRQIYFGTVVNLPSATQDTVGFYGGREERADAYIPMLTVTNQTLPISYDNITWGRGFDSMTVFNVTSRQWSYLNPQMNIPKSYYPNSFTGTLNPETGIVYYLGGNYYTPTYYSSPLRFPFTQSHTFDTRKGVWSVMDLQAGTSRIPSSRIYHTATMLPNSQDILLYGGTSDGELAVTDFIYTLNLISNNWTEQTNVNVPTSVTQSGARFGHSAVLVNSTLFLLFGKDINGSPSPNLLTFDVANVSNIAYTTTYPLVSTGQEKSIDFLSGGAKAGIAIGIILGVAAIATGAFFFYRHKKNHAIQRLEDEDVMHVDWDAIENQYREQAPPGYTRQPAVTRQTPDVYISQTLMKPFSPTGN